MKQISVTLFFILTTHVAFAQIPQIQPKVDERTELLSIVFRLAGSKEFVNNYLADYSKDIDVYFAPFKNHNVVKLARKLRQFNGVSFDAVMSMAVHLDIRDGIRFKEHLAEKSLDERWGVKNAEKFVKQLNWFYRDSGFDTFFANHQTLYTTAENNFSRLVSMVDFAWFQHFFGGAAGNDYNMVVSLTNGGCNYGMKVQFRDSTEEMYAIIGTYRTDSLGQPVYLKSQASTIIHEYNHSFCNPLIDLIFPEMEQQANRLYHQASEVLRKQGYRYSRSMTYEILVRACVIRYYQEKNHDSERIKSLIADGKRMGFLWIEELVNALSVYEQNRDQYPALKDFMPEIVKVQNRLFP
jgi:hypothetical protein